MSAPGPEGVFITWNDSRRSATLSRVLGVERVPLVTRRSGALRHLLGAAETVRYLASARPRLVWFQFSFVLGLVLAAYVRLGRRSGVRIATDVHTKALRRSGPAWLRWAILPAKRWALGSCCTVLVTNEANACYAERALRVPALVLPDPLPEPPRAGPGAPREGRPVVAVVCSYAVDEPLPAILETARLLAPAALLVLTGDPRRLEPRLRGELERVATLSGMLPEGEYWELLRRADCIAVLTTEPACLPCGAYEAIALGKRPVLAADPVARRVFGGSATFSALDPASLAEALLAGLGGDDAEEGPAVTRRYQERWRHGWRSVRAALAEQGAVTRWTWGSEGEPGAASRPPRVPAPAREAAARIPASGSRGTVSGSE